MYFLEQYKKQFICSIFTYFETPVGENPEEMQAAAKSVGEGPEQPDPAETQDRAKKTTEGLQTRIDKLPNPEGLAEGEERPKLTPEQMRDRVVTREAEREAARMILVNNGEIADDSAIVDHIVEGRRAEIGESVQVEVDGKAVNISQEALISQVAKQSGINAELLTEMKVMGQLGIHDMDGKELKDRLESMSEEMSRIKEQLEEDGQTLPEDPAEFLALYEIHMQDDGESDNREVDPEAAAANGIDVTRNPDGGFQIDPNTPGYRQVGDSVIGPPGAPYSRGGQVFTGTGEISREVNANLDASYSGLQENQNNPLSPDQIAQLKNPENKELLEKRIPAEWHGAAIKMENKISGQINPSYPIMIASMTEKRGLVCYPDGKVDEFPIIIGSGGYREGAHSGGATTPTYEVFNFNMNSKVTGRGVDASNSGSSTVLGASIQSPEGAVSGGKWWHGVADHRIPSGATLGCIGAKQENMMMAGRAILQAGGGYGFHTDTKAA